MKGGKAPWALHVVLLLHFQAATLNAFIPAGNQCKLFLCQFSPTPRFRWAPFSHQSPQWRICLPPLCPPLISFFGCSPLFADDMQRMQISSPLFPGSLPWMNAVLNEATLTHFYRGCMGVGGLWNVHAHITIRGFACPLWHAMSLISNTRQKSLLYEHNCWVHAHKNTKRSVIKKRVAIKRHAQIKCSDFTPVK